MDECATTDSTVTRAIRWEHEVAAVDRRVKDEQAVDHRGEALGPQPGGGHPFAPVQLAAEQGEGQRQGTGKKEDQDGEEVAGPRDLREERRRHQRPEDEQRGQLQQLAERFPELVERLAHRRRHRGHRRAPGEGSQEQVGVCPRAAREQEQPDGEHEQRLVSGGGAEQARALEPDHDPRHRDAEGHAERGFAEQSPPRCESRRPRTAISTRTIGSAIPSLSPRSTLSRCRSRCGTSSCPTSAAASTGSVALRAAPTSKAWSQGSPTTQWAPAATASSVSGRPSRSARPGRCQAETMSRSPACMPSVKRTVNSAISTSTPTTGSSGRRTTSPRMPSPTRKPAAKQDGGGEHGPLRQAGDQHGGDEAETHRRAARSRIRLQQWACLASPAEGSAETADGVMPYARPRRRRPPPRHAILGGKARATPRTIDRG